MLFSVAKRKPKMSHLLLVFAIFTLIFTDEMYPQNRRIIGVSNERNVPLKYPWAGGMNSIQFGEIDLDRNGQKDLIAFDRMGNRKMCFINYGVYQQIDYRYSPEYTGLLPDLFDWAIFKDYNGDGKTDIFTFSPGWAGMMVYKNISEDILKFELVVYPFLKTFQENGYVNLLVTDVDYPGIADIDLDGDLDILSFWGLGSFVNYHRNMSMEKYGHADSLDYRLEEYCWGNFAESEESNEIYFDTCFISGSPGRAPTSDERHTGSTFLLLDLNKDTVFDLLLGDVDYPNLFALENTGNKYHAEITALDKNFPSTSEKVHLFSFPVAAYIDVDNNNTKDLLVSPFDPSLDNAANKKSVWLYLNTGANNKPFFKLASKNFLQSEMIDRGSGAYPVLFDWNGDGLLDLFVGNYGYYKYSYYDDFFRLISVFQSRIGYFKNTGSAEAPVFQLWDDDFGGLSKLNKTGLVPSFIDIDGDGKTDMLVGDSLGNLIYARNLGDGDFEIVTEHFIDINDGLFSTPQIFDLDKDGLKDLILGEENGNLNYYQNEGNASIPSFVFVTDSLGKVNVSDYNTSWHGYSVPWFFHLPSGETQLLVGSEQGKVFYFTNIDDNLNGKFTESDELGNLLDTSNVSFDQGIRAGAAIGELTNDGKLEMIVGNFSGGLEYFNGNADVMPGFTDIQDKHNAIQIVPNPTKGVTELIVDSDQASVILSIYKTSGQAIVKDQQINLQNGHSRLDTSNLDNGIYIIFIRTKKAIYTAKLIVQH